MAKKLPRLSPSGAKTVERCMTKWWFEKVAGRRAPTTAAQSIGLAIHERCENYIQTGAWGVAPDDPVLPLVKPGLAALQDMREGYLHRGGEVEKLYEIPRGEWPVPVFCRTDYVEHDYGLVVDHKSTRDIYSQWVPTPFDLAKDPQMLWYGYLEWRNDPNPPEIFEVQHTYFSSESPASRVVRVRTTWENATSVAKNFGRIANIMYDAAQVLQPEELEYNLDACGDYGGCPHRNYCPHLKAKTAGLSSLRNRLKRTKTKKTPRQEKPTMGFRDRKKKQLEAAQAAEETAEVTTPGEGQGNPGDTPGTEDPTEQQLEEICDAILDEDSGVGATASNAEIMEWFDSDDGSAALTRAGLGKPHRARILAYWNGDVESEPEETEETEDPVADATGGVAGGESNDTDSDVVSDDEHPIVVYLRDKGGDVKLDDKGLAKILRELTGAGQIRAKKRKELLKGYRTEGLLEFNEVWVFLPTDEMIAKHGAGNVDDESFDKNYRGEREARLAREAAAEKGEPPLKLVSDPPAEKPDDHATPAFGMVILVDCVPMGTGAESDTIDAVLEPYYDVADNAAVDEDGNKVGNMLLWAYNKGPSTVAALVKADVREGKFRAPNMPLTISRDHFMYRHIGRMFPHARIFKGV